MQSDRDYPLKDTFAKGSRNLNIQFAVSQKSGNRTMCVSLLGENTDENTDETATFIVECAISSSKEQYTDTPKPKSCTETYLDMVAIEILQLNTDSENDTKQ